MFLEAADLWLLHLILLEQYEQRLILENPARMTYFHMGDVHQQSEQIISYTALLQSFHQMNVPKTKSMTLHQLPIWVACQY